MEVGLEVKSGRNTQYCRNRDAEIRELNRLYDIFRRWIEVINAEPEKKKKRENRTAQMNL